MSKCCAFKCNNTGVHKFPKDPKIRKQWENSLGIENFKATQTTRLCSAHFKESDYYGKSQYTILEKPLSNFLKRGTIPSLFYDKKKPKNNELLKQLEFDDESLKAIENDPATSPSSAIIKEELEDVAPEEFTEDINLGPGCNTNEVEDMFEISDITLVKSVPQFTSQGTQVDHVHMYGSIRRFTQDDKAIHFYTGFESYEKFKLVFNTLSPMTSKIKYYRGNVKTVSIEDQFFLTLMKLRQNKCVFELSRFFNVSESTVSNIFMTWVSVMYQLWSKLTIVPIDELLHHYMPENLKICAGNIIDTLDHTGQRAKFQSQIPGLDKVIGLTKTYKILNSELDRKHAFLARKIFFVCFMCCSFRESIKGNKIKKVVTGRQGQWTTSRLGN